MAQAVAEVPEADAEGKIKNIYDDIKETLRVPVVSPVFRALALYPDYLQMAWRVLKPNVQIVYFERSADNLRRAAVQAVQGMNVSPNRGIDDVGTAVRALHYASAKDFLATAALRAATGGQQPKLSELPGEDKRQIQVGVPAELDGVGLTTESPSAEIQAILEEMNSTLGSSLAEREILPLVRWPDYLRSAWQVWQPTVTDSSFLRVRRELSRLVEAVVTGFPFRMDIYPHALRHAGLTEQQLDDVRSLLSEYYRLLPGILATASFLRLTVDQGDRALESPYPATVL